MAQQRSDLDKALVAEGRDHEKVSILWSSRAIVGETEAEAAALRETMIADVPLEAVGAWLSHNTGYDMSLLSLKELNDRIVAANASPVGFVNLLAKQHGETAEIDRNEFFQYALRASTGYNITFAGTAAKLADQMEEMFEATGNRGGFMLSIAPGSPRAIMLNIVDQLVPELKRRGRYRNTYEGKTLRDNLAD
jgi:alkanesulfonate monooxygenase SsuD/methylene tetrahydromethanopterin reductase-like flavin-dependent oxidoreductase (luciferase family)